MYRKTRGEVNNIESILSKIPPCPGSIFPVSFKFIFLLNIDSDKSPATPNIEIIPPNTNRSDLFKELNNPGIKQATTIVTMVPPINPSQVFFGEILLKSLCLPTVTPNIYAEVSLVHIKTRYPKRIEYVYSDKLPGGKTK